MRVGRERVLRRVFVMSKTVAAVVVGDNAKQ
jgi:hypothetical protein